MRKEEYVKKERDIESKIDVLRTELADLKSQYAKDIIENIKEDYGVEIGDKVNVTYCFRNYNKEIECKSVECFFGGSKVIFGYPKPTFYEVKKDGTQSQKEKHIFYDIVKIEKV